MSDSRQSIADPAAVIRELREYGCTVQLVDGSIDLDFPGDLLCEYTLAWLRIHRDKLVLVLEQERADSLSPGAFQCPWCGPADMRVRDEGLLCLRCYRLAWTFTERSMIRADYAGADFDGVPWLDGPKKTPGERKPETRNKREVGNTSGELF